MTNDSQFNHLWLIDLFLSGALSASEFEKQYLVISCCLEKFQGFL
ncbi:Uncharacterised protein [Salmonella enterica]|nr:Uncharacterised protein [Salmonella enterica]